jgi:hypothetical protein
MDGTHSSNSLPLADQANNVLTAINDVREFDRA